MRLAQRLEGKGKEQKEGTHSIDPINKERKQVDQFDESTIRSNKSYLQQPP